MKVQNNKELNSEELKWFLFDQNNSGGSFTCNKFLTHNVYIQAKDIDEAIDILSGLGAYFDGVSDGRDCSCCGDRWSRHASEISLPQRINHRPFIASKDATGYYEGEEIVLNTIEEYAQYQSDTFSWCIPDAYIYYYGSIDPIAIYKKGTKI